jgi:ubiquinone/menaquinone biosynthesis C-methylase UbiE
MRSTMKPTAATGSLATSVRHWEDAMTATTTDGYVMGRTPEEYERLRQQARVWEQATATLLDRVSPRPGGRCLDVGCGPGETMRLMASRVGPEGSVVGLDTDGDLGRAAVDALHAAGHRQCSFVEADVETAGDVAAFPDGFHLGFDLVFARLLLLHLSDPVAALRRMWSWVVPGGHLVVQDYDLRAVDAYPSLGVVDEWRRVFLGTFTAVGRDIRLGQRLPALFAEAGIGAPDGTEVVGRLEPFATAAAMLSATYRSVSPAAVALGIVTEQQRDGWLAEVADATVTHGHHQAYWPLMVGAHKRRPTP